MQDNYTNKRSLHQRPARYAMLRERPEDFVVHEVPAYLPSGQGEHLFVHFEKRNLTTNQAVSSLSRLLHVPERSIGVAGQKDKYAVTRQWVSIPGVTAAQLNGALDSSANLLEGLHVLEATPHEHKLKTGHLRGNRFEITLRETDLTDEDLTTFKAAVIRDGVPNYFGVQRFRDNTLVDRAAAWLRGEERSPRAKQKLKWWMSTVQSALFNAWLNDRLDRGELGRCVEGDVLKKEDTGGIFVSEDATTDSARVSNWEVSPTGPIWGAKMRRAQSEADARERAVLAVFGLAPEHFEGNKRAGAGTRRVARVRPQELSFERKDAATVLARFALPKGCYATELLRELLGTDPEKA